MNIVVTGKIGSGKSTVTNFLRAEFPQHDFLSVDEIVQKLYQQREICEELQKRFGTSQKTELSKLAFTDKNVKDALEELLTPLVETQLHQAIQRSLDDDRAVLCEFPLFRLAYGAVFDAYFQVAICVNSDANVIRAQTRDKCDSQHIFNVLRYQETQRPFPETLQVFTVNNSGISLAELQYSVCTLAQSLKQQESAQCRIGLVSGSFDPITHGHCHVISQALRIVDRVGVVLASNQLKSCMFSPKERFNLITASLREYLTEQQYARVFVISLPAGELLVKLATKLGASFVIRGIRNYTDWEYEHQLDLIQKRIAPDVETLYLMTPRDKMEISSSMIRGALALSDWEEVVSDYITESVLRALREKKALQR